MHDIALRSEQCHGAGEQRQHGGLWDLRPERGEELKRVGFEHVGAHARGSLHRQPGTTVDGREGTQL